MEIPKDTSPYAEAIQAVLQLNRLFRRYWKKMRAEGVNGRQYAILRCLNEKEPRTIGSISSYLYISESSTSEQVSKLEKAGLLQRIRSQKDNRIVEVSLSESGRSFVQRIPPGGIPLLREKLKKMPEDDLHRIRNVLEHLISLIETEYEK